jgi:hypothetical protein
MTNYKLSEKTMNTNRNILWLAGAVLACAVLAAPAARAQTVSSLAPTANSSVGTTLTKVGTTQAIGVGAGPVTATPIKSLPPMILAGTVSCTMLFMPNATGNVDSAAYTLSAEGVVGQDSAGNVYKFPAGFAVITRPFAAADQLLVNLALQGPGGITDIHTIALAVNIANDIVAKVLSSASVGFSNPTNTAVAVAAVP